MRTRNSEHYKLVYRMVRFVLTLPVPTATIEQAFSTMKVRRLWHFTLNLKKKKKKNWQYAPICKLYRSVPLFRYSIILKSSSIKYSICRKSSYARSNLKKKNSMELEFQEIKFHAKKIFISVITPYSGSPIVAFLSPIVTF